MHSCWLILIAQFLPFQFPEPYQWLHAADGVSSVPDQRAAQCQQQEPGGGRLWQHATATHGFPGWKVSRLTKISDLLIDWLIDWLMTMFSVTSQDAIPFQETNNKLRLFIYFWFIYLFLCSFSSFPLMCPWSQFIWPCSNSLLKIMNQNLQQFKKDQHQLG